MPAPWSAPHPVARPCLLALLALAAACGHSRSAARPDGSPEPADDEISTGYGTEPRATSSASVSSLNREQIHDRHAASLQELLERLPGVDVVRQRDGLFSVRIRGIRTMSGDNEPLFVVDGVARTSAGFTHALEAIEPSSIDRIDVLKDAGSLAMYGSRGANGVIVVTTIRGR